MFKYFANIPKLCCEVTNVLTSQPNRTTFILRRKFPPGLYKKGQRPKKLRARHMIYETVESTDLRKQPDLEVILTDYVEGLGEKGDRVQVKANIAYNKLLLPGLAVYVTPANIERYCKEDTSKEKKFSSPYVQRTLGFLSNMQLRVVMNKDMPWTIEPWHIKASFRKQGVIVPEEAIKIPDEPITGPDLEKEHKIFFVTVTINGQEQINVKCRLHHWSNKLEERMPYVPEFWNLPDRSIFEQS